MKFGLVGGSGVIVNLAVVVVLQKLTGMNDHQVREALFQLWPTSKSVRVYHLFAMAAFVVANVWNFEINRFWTFGGENRASRKRLLRFFAVGLVAQLFGLFIMTLLMTPGSLFGLPRDVFDGSTGLRRPLYWAQLIQVLCTTPISFVLQKLWTFASLGSDSDASESEPAPQDRGTTGQPTKDSAALVSTHADAAAAAGEGQLTAPATSASSSPATTSSTAG
ncbi:GtrA family protein [Austwickia sp. TVS 96-490-7B]|uniref:GtrA family protein n=1 Tax=Austwickia sp. TVS 96-490-7B TaxID=2830843 RepID=UPI001C59E299|nr:GtrA family protein [Austwickia sp. TVS 96-490-7B]